MSMCPQNLTKKIIYSIPPWFGPLLGPPRFFGRFDSVEERHLQAKHEQLYPDTQTLDYVSIALETMEETLKQIAEQFKKYVLSLDSI